MFQVHLQTLAIGTAAVLLYEYGREDVPIAKIKEVEDLDWKDDATPFTTESGTRGGGGSGGGKVQDGSSPLTDDTTKRKPSKPLFRLGGNDEGDAIDSAVPQDRAYTEYTEETDTDTVPPSDVESRNYVQDGGSPSKVDTNESHTVGGKTYVRTAGKPGAFSGAEVLPRLTTTLHESIVPCRVNALHRILFTDTQYYSTLCKQMGWEDLVFSPWGQSGSTKERTLSYSLEVAMGLKKTTAYEVQKQLVSKKGNSYVVDTEVRTPDIQFGQSFLTRVRYSLQMHGPNETHLIVTCQVEYLKSVWSLTRAVIEKSAIAGMATFWEHATVLILQTVVQDTTQAMSIASSFGDFGDDAVSTPSSRRLRRSVSVESLHSLVSSRAVARVKPPFSSSSFSMQLWYYAVLGMIMLSNILLTFRLAALESQVANLSWVLKEQDISSTSQSQSCFSEDLDCS